MKKEKMITRTLIFTDVEIVAFDSTTMTGAKKVVPVVGNLKTDKEAMKAVSATCVPDGVVIVSAKVVGHSSKLYGMTENVFYQMADELPPRKVYEYDIVSTD